VVASGGVVSRGERQQAICALQEVRGGTEVISYITSTRPNLEGQMGMDSILPLYRHLQALQTPPNRTRIDLFLHSNGGDSIVPWRLVTLIREFCCEFNVLVPHRAFSAATLTALGADTVTMHPMGMLGPTDPSINGPFNPSNPLNAQQLLPVSVEDVSSYIALIKDDVGIRHEDELIKAFLALAEKVHPLTLGSVKRTTSQSRMLAAKLLHVRGGDPMAPSAIDEVVNKLTSKLFFHGHPINSREAREEVGLHFVEQATPEVAAAMWSLYEMYHIELQFDKPFQVQQEATAKNPLNVPPPGAMPGPRMPGATAGMTQATVRLDPLRFAIIESMPRTDIFQAEYEVTILRDHLGNYQSGQPQVLSQRWTEET
jgi:Serine dehydrogenase proteinase